MNLEIHTWQGLLQHFVILFLAFWTLKFLVYLLGHIGRKSTLKKSITGLLQKILLVYKPLATVLLLLDFISMNYVVHSLLLAIISLFSYSHVKNYLNGIVLKLNPLIGKGASVIIDETIGTVKSLQPLGLTVSTETGERYMNYSGIEELGFTIVSNAENTLRQTLFLETELSKQALLDLLFDNPILHYDEAPTLEVSEDETKYRLKYTLEKGATSEDLMAFLQEYKVKVTFKK